MELVKEQFAPKLLQWTAEISEENKKVSLVIYLTLSEVGSARTEDST